MITPIEIRQHAFKSKTLGGFDKEEVNSFLSSVSMDFEKTVEENRRLKTELDKTVSSLESYKQIESVLHKTLQQAEQTSKSTVENAKRDAELKIAEAEAKYKELLNNAMKERSRIELETTQLTAYRNDIFQQLKLFLSAQHERLKSFEEKEMKMVQSSNRQENSGTSGNENYHSPKDSQNRIINEIADEL